MAGSKEATLIIKIKEVGLSALGAIKSGLSSIGNAAKSGASALRSAFNAQFVVTLGDIVNGVKRIASALVGLGTQAASFDEVKRAFTNLAIQQGADANQMLQNMRRLTSGTISDLSLMKQANSAMLLGLPVDRFDEMLEIARSSAKSTGQSMDFMLNSIVTGLGRGSKLMLDNLGILVDVEKANEKYAASLGKTASQLTDGERKLAFINEALRIGKANSDAAGAANMSLGDMFQQVSARAENFAVTLGQSVGPSFQFFIEKTMQAFDALQKFTSSDMGSSAFMFMTKAIAVTSSAFEGLGKTIGVVVASAVNTLVNAVTLDFRGVQNAVLVGVEMMAEGAKSQWEGLQKDLKRIDDLYAARKVADVVASEDQLRAVRDRKAAEERAAKEQRLLEQQMLDQQRIEGEIALIGETDERKAAIQIAALDERLATATSHEEKMNLLKERHTLLDLQREAKTVAAKKKLDEETMKNRQDTLGKIATMQSSNNQLLATVGKAAALTQIAIETPVAIARALSAFPPPFNFGAAAAVGAAMAAQAAQVAGIPLAEGGIVMPRPGGVQATIAEAGQPEAVIPLDKAGMIGGNNITIQVYGGLLGDDRTAYELAVAVDRELYKLRQQGASVAFDRRL